MGSKGSFMARHCHLIDLMHTIHTNDLKGLKRKFEHAKTTDILILLLETICKERIEFFDFIIEKLSALTENLSRYIDSGYYEECFSKSVKCSDIHYAKKLLEAYNFIPSHMKSRLLSIAVNAENEFVTHELILKGADVNALDIVGQTPLDIAVSCNNLNMVYLFLFYGAYANNIPNNLTTFMYSIICRCSEEIQRTLMDYECDFNLTCNSTSTLFFAIMYQSPLILDIIDRGADVNYYDGENNTISLALMYNCHPKIFKELWDKFDYNVWKTHFDTSVFYIFLHQDPRMEYWEEYLQIFMENETKLQLELEQYNSSYLYSHDDYILSIFYLWCLEKHLKEDLIEGYIFQLLSHGACLFKEEIDIMCTRLNGTETPFLNSLLYMDLQGDDLLPISIMYFKYTALPEINVFVTNTIFASATNNLHFAKRFFAISDNIQRYVLYICSRNGHFYSHVKNIFQECVSFPSLLQLSRDATRKWIYLKFEAHNSCKMITLIKNLHLPAKIKKILLFEAAIYNFPV